MVLDSNAALPHNSNIAYEEQDVSDGFYQVLYSYHQILGAVGDIVGVGPLILDHNQLLGAILVEA